MGKRSGRLDSLQASNLLHYFPVMKKEISSFSERLASTKETTRRPNPVQRQHFTNRSENLKSQNTNNSITEPLIHFAVVNLQETMNYGITLGVIDLLCFGCR
jgi:hypothetical protein